MKLTTRTGSAIVVHDNTIKVVAFEPGPYPGTYNFDDGGSDEIHGHEYDDRFDVYRRMGDDGTIYESIHLTSSPP